MERTRLLAVAVISAALLFGINGCSSGKLDRKTAGSKISERLATMGPKEMVEIGRIGANCGYNSDTKEEYTMDPNRDIHTVVAVKAGYISVVPDGEGYWKVDLTPQGQSVKPYEIKGAQVTRKGCEYKKMVIPMAKPVLAAVSGIIEQDKNTAIVDFQWKWELTDLGRRLQEGGDVNSRLTKDERELLDGVLEIFVPRLHIPVPANAESKLEDDKTRFIKYDDGWRMESD